MPRPAYPFTAFVGQEKAKTALMLSAIDPRLGGVLITGPKGSGKSTIVRALRDILPVTEYVEGCPFNCNPKEPTQICPPCRERLGRGGELPVAYRRMRIVELPVSATEDGLLGTTDPEEAFRKGVKVLQPGLLGKANQNILYIDGVNLLPGHLVDCILDPAVSGWNVVQREGLSLAHPSRFTLIASMNPEEGELRPQILDRFALKVDMDRLTDPKKREEVARRNLSFEEDPAAFCKEHEVEQARLRERIQEAREALSSIKVPETVMRGIAEACSKLRVEGVRSDIAILKAARALAAFEERDTVEPDDAVRVFDLALRHRIKEEGGETSAWAHMEELKRILFREAPPKVDKEALELGPSMADISLETASVSPPPGRAGRRRIRIPSPLNSLIYILTVVALIFFLSVVSSMTSLFLQAMFYGLPIEVLRKALTFRRVLLHFCVLGSVFAVLFLLSRRIRRPVVYLYTYLGSGIKRQIVQQQAYPAYEEGGEEKKAVETSNIINIPLYASLRRLYKMIVGKGAKILEVGLREKRRRYKFLFEPGADRRLRSTVGRQTKTKARSEYGRYVSYEFPKSKPWDLALGPTIRAAAPFQRSRDRGGLALKVDVEDVRVKVREMRAPTTVVLLLDMSESMIPALVNVRNAVLSMHDIVSKKRGRVGLVIFKGQGATTLQSPTANLNLVAKRFMEVGASDLTPLAPGMFEARRVLNNEKVKNKDAIPVLVIISDGIANIPLESPLSTDSRSRFLNRAQADVIDVAYLLLREGVRTLVINPSHVPPGSIPASKYTKNKAEQSGKQWLEPTELLMEIPRITGGWYYGIGEEGELEQVILTKAFRVLGY